MPGMTPWRPLPHGSAIMSRALEGHVAGAWTSDASPQPSWRPERDGNGRSVLLVPTAHKVFISHSSKDPFSIAVRDAVVKQLRAKNYQVVIDKDTIKPGDAWREVIYQEIVSCHTAVLLLSREALASQWVKTEIHILQALRSVMQIRLIPVLIDHVESDDVKAAGLDLSQIHYAKLDARKTGKPAAARRLATMVTDLLPALEETPAIRDDMQKWIDRVTHFLMYVRNDESIDDCARYLGIKEDALAYLRLPEGRRILASRLLDQELTNYKTTSTYKTRSTSLAMRAIADFLDRDLLTKLIRDIAFVWVNMQAARQLLEIYEEPRSGIALLNALSPLTAYDYLDRATFRGVYWCEQAGTPVGENAVGELVAHYERAIKSLNGIEPPFTEADMTPRTDGICGLVVDPTGVPLKLVAQAVRITHDKYPWLVILLMTGDTIADQEIIATLGPERARVLSPALGPQEEFNARRLAADLHKLYR